VRKLGIDLGTTNTVACLEQRVLGIDRDGETGLPSVVAFLPNGEMATGRSAVRRRVLDAPNTIFSSKRLIGRHFDEAETRKFRERYPVEVVDAGGNRPAFKTRAGLHSPTDMFLGGDDVDRKLADWVTLEVLKLHNWDLANHSDIAARLLSECESAKIQLATRDEVRLDLSRVDPDCPLAQEGLLLRRNTLDSLCTELIQRSFRACDEGLAAAGLQAGQLSAVLLAGGTTHLPVIREAVEHYFGRTPSTEHEPTQVVALGACMAPPPRGS
jgi:molecular chaperone DnaK (HSP70)